MPRGVYIRRNFRGKPFLSPAIKGAIKADKLSGMSYKAITEKWGVSPGTIRSIETGDWNPARTRNRKLKEAEFALIAEERERCAKLMEDQFGENNYLARRIRKDPE